MPVVLIIGAGARVGQACAETFAAAGYEVAVASRSQKLDPAKFRFFYFDAAEPETVPTLFEKVVEEVGVPSVVIYNAYESSPFDPSVIFEIRDAKRMQTRMSVNAVSPYMAAYEAIKGFEALYAQKTLGPEGATFIFTGNLFNDTAVAGFMSFGMSKSASAHMIQSLALTAYNDKPFKFYWGDEREADGEPMFNGPTAEPHAKEYIELAQDPKQRPWQYTFADGKGYIKFPKKETLQ